MILNLVAILFSSFRSGLRLGVAGFFLFVLCCYSWSAEAQTSATLSGQVRDADANEVLGYATVRLFNPQDSLIAGTITEENGRFSLEADAGTYTLRISFVGYQTLTQEDIQLQAGEETRLGQLALQSAGQTLGEVEVEAERSQTEVKLDKRVFNVGQDLSSAGGTAQDVLDNVPSVSVDIDGNVSLRGSQNVRIFINGQPSGLSQTEALQLLQANQIDRIEVITNPSAKYEAEGEAGIINIILKKNKQKGFNGSVEVSAGVPDNYGLGVNANLRRGAFNWFGSYSLNYRKTPGFSDAYRETYNDDTTVIFKEETDRFRGGLGHNLRLGTDYNLAPNQVLTVRGVLGIGDDRNKSDITYTDLNEAGAELGRTQRNSDETEDEETIEFRADYENKFAEEDHKFNATLQWTRDDDLEVADIDEFPAGRPEAGLTQRTSNTENEENYLAQLDFVHPLTASGKWETGVKATRRVIDNRYFVANQRENGSFDTLSQFNEDYQYDEYIYAAYLQGSRSFGNLEVQAGLRAELTDIRTELLISGTESRRDYLNFFPSAAASYDVNENNSLQFSLSRRLSRPRFRLLLPFSNYNDSRSFYGGNPDLNPEYTYSYEVGYLRYLSQGSLGATAYFRDRSGIIERISRTDSAGFTTRLPVNLAQGEDLGLEFTLNYDISKKGRFNANLNLFQSQIRGAYQEQDFDFTASTFNARVSTQWEVGQELFDVQVSGRLRGPQNTPQGRREGIYTMDMGLSRDFWNRKATLSFSARDLFNSRVYRYLVDTEDQFVDGAGQWRARQLLLRFAYRINQDRGRGNGDRGGDF